MQMVHVIVVTIHQAIKIIVMCTNILTIKRRIQIKVLVTGTGVKTIMT